MTKQGVIKIVGQIFQAVLLIGLLATIVHLAPRVLGQRENGDIRQGDSNVDAPSVEQEPGPSTPSPSPTPTATATPFPTPTPTPAPTPPAVCVIEGTLGAPGGSGDTGTLTTRIYRPGTPTVTCARVTPPSPFNHGRGPFVYNVHYVTNTTASPLCTTVTFLVLNGGSPVGRMEVSAFQAPFVAADITNSARYLGDAGRSAAFQNPATSFQLTIPANTTIALVVYNVNLSPAGQGGIYSIGLDQPLCGWSLATTGDFNGDSNPDYVLTHGISSRTAIWYLNNNVLVSGTLGPALPVHWRVPAVADFNADSLADYCLSNVETQRTAIWYLNNNVLIGTGYGPTLPPGWSLASAADFNGDSRPDYLIFDPITGRTAVWYLSDNALIRGSYGPTLPPSWLLISAADFNGDSKPDYLLYNPSTRHTAIWYLNNNVFVSALYGPTLPPGWSLVTAADFNGDSKPDYLLYNASTRQTAIWYLNNNVFVSALFGPTLPPD